MTFGRKERTVFKYLSLAPLMLCWSAFVLQPIAAAEKLPAYLQAGEQRLVLNGSGVRTKTLLELYTAGLYLLKPTNNANAVIAAEEPMALRIKITSGFVSQSSLVESLEDGFKNATGGELVKSANRLISSASASRARSKRAMCSTWSISATRCRRQQEQQVCGLIAGPKIQARFVWYLAS